MSKAPLIQCRNCLYISSHPFGIAFDETGLCSGCKIHQEKDLIDWRTRLEDLKKLTHPYKSRNNNHDCIIHVDGSAESFHVIHLVKNILGFEPLLVNFNSHFNNDIGIHNLAKLRTIYDCDFIQFTLCPSDYKKILRETIIRFNHVLWPYIAGKTSLPAQIAIKRRIPLVFWGGLQTVEQVGMFSHLDGVEMTRWSRKNHDLFGVDEESFVESSGLVSENDLEIVAYPSDADLMGSGLKQIYLSNYFRWDPLLQNAATVKYGFIPEKQSRSFDPYEYAGCSVFYGIHDLSREIRTGYPKVLDQVCREIRFGRISKKDGEALVNKCSKLVPNDIDEFWDFLDIKPSARTWLKDFIFHRGLFSKDNFVNGDWTSDKSFVFEPKAKIAQTKFITYGKGIYL